MNLANAAQFFRAGCELVGVGGELINQDLLDKKDFDTITERARGFMAAAEQGGAKEGGAK